MLDYGQELWAAPPFPDGTILEVETTMGHVYLVTVLSMVAPHRQEGESLVTEVGSGIPGGTDRSGLDDPPSGGTHAMGRPKAKTV